VVGIRRDDLAVTIVVRTTGGGRELCARYLVGCDGADSTVRELVGFGAGTDATVPGWMAVVDMVDQEKLRPGFHYPAERRVRAPGSAIRPERPFNGRLRFARYEFGLEHAM
jgi:2-polyprenyl-6-methoxyphenol hydroxylase-like FAD-dependent oxidoreductase